MITPIPRTIKIRAAAHHATVAIGTRFPDVLPLTFVLGYPKSGTSWACQIVGDYLQLPFPQFYILPVTFQAVIHGHELPTRRFKRCVYIMRDGRDVMVSEYFERWRRLPPEAPRGMTRQQRKAFPKLRDRDNHLENMRMFIPSQLERPTISPTNWGDHVLAALDSDHPNLPILRYEDLLRDGPATLAAAMAQFTGSERDDERARATIEKYSFERQAGRPRGVERKNIYYRKGQKGDWKNHFERELAQVFDHFCGEALIRAGYERDRSWVDRCPDAPPQAEAPPQAAESPVRLSAN